MCILYHDVQCKMAGCSRRRLVGRVGETPCARAAEVEGVFIAIKRFNIMYYVFTHRSGRRFPANPTACDRAFVQALAPAKRGKESVRGRFR